MKTIFLIFLLSISILSCSDNAKSVKTENHQVIEMSTLPQAQSQETPPRIDLIWEIDNLKLYGDTSIDNAKISYASIKFEPFIGFEDFKTSEVDHTKYATFEVVPEIRTAI